MPDQLPDQKTPQASILRERETPYGQSNENISVVEVGQIPETEAEHEGLISRVEEVELREPIQDDDGNNLVTSTYSAENNIVLPVTEATFSFKDNWHKPVTSAIRWLLVWAGRIIKMNPGGAGFKKD